MNRRELPGRVLAHFEAERIELGVLGDPELGVGHVDHGVRPVHPLLFPPIRSKAECKMFLTRALSKGKRL